MDSNIEVRLAIESDLDQLAILFNGYRIFYKQEHNIEAARSFLGQRLLENDSKIFVAVNQESKLSGFVQLYPIFSSVRMKRVWLLNDLFISKEQRGKGISHVLMNRAKQLARETKSAGLRLETEKTNEIGNVLYPKQGFTFDAETNHYFWLTK